MRVGPLEIACHDPAATVRFVGLLRAKGAPIAPCDLEVEKGRRLVQDARDRQTLTTVEALVERFEPHPADFERFCAHIFQRLGYRVALATNPIFPSIATCARIRWAGLTPEDFAFVTTYENSAYCKPNPDYYRDAAQRLGLSPEECLMVGNDAQEDMIAETTGMKVFLLTDCLINRDGADISIWPNGGFDELLRRIESEWAKAPLK